MSIGSRWRALRASDRFFIAFPIWLLILFGLFYWGRYWDLSPIGRVIDNAHRTVIMALLDNTLANRIIGYEIVISPHFRIVITPECNGLVPYYIFLAAVLAYPNHWWCKLKWAFIGYIVIMATNFVRLVAVTEVVNSFGAASFYYVHDIAGNLFLIIVGSLLFLLYLRGCHAKE